MKQIKKENAITIAPSDLIAGDNAQPRPLYAQVKDFIRRMIEEREWLPNTRIPSENEIVKSLGVSRMTVNRALRELVIEGLLTRLHGVGTFVAQPRSVSAIMEIRDIADEITESGGVHNCDVLVLREDKANSLVAKTLKLTIGSPVFHSLILHKDHETPILLTQRWVNPAVAPDYLKQDFTKETTSSYLCRVAPVTESDFFIEARMPLKETSRLLQLKENEPCLLLSRTITSGSYMASLSWFTYPGFRYRLRGYFRSHSPNEQITTS
jgi:GntR family histidine utilization transcriptional repressor